MPRIYSAANYFSYQAIVQRGWDECIAPPLATMHRVAATCCRNGNPEHTSVSALLEHLELVHVRRGEASITHACPRLPIECPCKHFG